MPCKRSRCCANSPLKFILKHCLLHYKQTRQRYLYLLSSTNLPFGWWTLTDRRPINSLMELLFPELKTHYRLMLDSKTLLRISANWTRTNDGLAADKLTVCCGNTSGCTGWIRTSTYSINSRGEYPSRHGTLIVFKLVGEASSRTGAFWSQARRATFIPFPGKYPAFAFGLRARPL